MSLNNKSLTQLRAIAQSYDVADIFQKDAILLIQAIELKQKGMIPAPKIEILKPEYDARLMTKIPSRKSVKHEIEELLAPYAARGLALSFDEENWFMSIGKKNDSGTIRQPLRQILRCADKLMV